MTSILDRAEGYWPLQDHRREVKGAVGARLGPAGVRIVNAEGSDDERLLTIDAVDGKGTAGDLPAYRWWAPDSRDCGAWGSALLARVTSTEGESKDSKGRPITGGGAPTTGVLPVRLRSYAPDTAFKTASHSLPTWYGPWPKGTLAIGMAGTREDAQEDLLAYVDPRIRCVNKNEHDEMGTHIVDLDPIDTMSERRSAYFQTMARVVLTPAVGDLGATEGPTAALQFALTGQGKQLGLGAAYARLATGGGQQAPERKPRGGGDGQTVETHPNRSGDGKTVAKDKAPDAKNGVMLLSADAWGGLCPGHTSDQHRLGTTPDGEPVNSGHLDVDRHLFFRDQSHDAPLEFDRKIYDPVPAPITTRAWIRYDVRSNHGWVNGQRRGLWRLVAESFFTQKDKPGPPTFDVPTTPGDPPNPPPGGGEPPPAEPSDPANPPGEPSDPSSPGTPGGPVVTPGTGPGTTDSPPTDYRVEDAPNFNEPAEAPWPANTPPTYPDLPGTTPSTPGSGTAPGDTTGPTGWWTPPGSEPPPITGGTNPAGGFNPSMRFVQRADPTTHAVEAVAYSPMQIGLPGALIFPQHAGLSGAVDLRYSAMPPASAIAKAVAQTPAVARVGSWAKESGETFGYTQKPGYSRVPGGTTNGVVLVMPPEVDEMDAVDSMAPSGVTVSEGYFGWAPGMSAAWGSPGVGTGSMASQSWRAKRNVLSATSTSLAIDHTDGATWSPAVSFVRDATNGIGSSFSGSYIKLPITTTAGRPASPTTGMLLANSDLVALQTYLGGAWQTLISSAVGAAAGALVAVTVYATGAGTHTWNAATTNSVEIGVGGGGGGGGVAGATAAMSAVGAGGASGSMFIHRRTGITGGGTIAYAVGAGGAGGAVGGGAGGNGVVTTLGALTAPGGVGGGFTAETAVGGAVAGGVAAIATGASLVNGGGNPGLPGIKLGPAVSIGGAGGCSHLGGGGGVGFTNDGNGVAGVGPGAGGGGASSTDATLTDWGGGAGVEGVIVIYEYA